MNKNFDKAKLSALVKQAVGSTQQKVFAEKIQLSREHLSRIINGKYNSPPEIETIKKIASNAMNGVTYFELLEAAGYAATGDVPDNFILPKQPAIEKFISGTILTALQSLNTSWALKTDNTESTYNLSISFSNGLLRHWYFLFLNTPNEELRKNQFNSNYLNLVFEYLEPNDKISFVTSLDDEYQLYIERTPNNLNLNLSVILIDESSLSVKAEYWLHTTPLLDNKTKESYSL